MPKVYHKHGGFRLRRFCDGKVTHFSCLTAYPGVLFHRRSFVDIDLNWENTRMGRFLPLLANCPR
jgi:hypothetical protein